MENNKFAQRLKELRRKINLSQTELGKLAGLHYTNIGRYERGLSLPSSEKLKALAEVLEVTTDYLIEGKGQIFAKARIEDQDLLQMFKEVEQFSDEDKIVVKKFLDAFITKKKVQSLVK